MVSHSNLIDLHHVICSNCQTSNPESHSFCSHCGELLGDRCPRCSFSVDGSANFCGSCGLALSPKAQFLWQPDAAFPARSTPVQPSSDPAKPPADPLPETPGVEAGLDQYIPRELRTKLEAARARGGMEGERRVVTMLFCDVKGSTEAAGRLDPEDWTEIINGAFEYMIRPVYKYEGTVARLMGDGILAFFGAPIAHEDDPRRAVLTGLDIVSGLAPYRERIRQRWNIEINVRVGINTGLVVVGAVGSDLRMEYTAMGDAINLAARMEQTAVPGTIQIAHDTYKQVAPFFEFEDLGRIEIKGKAEPVPAYRVLGQKATAGRARGIEGLEAEMVGRSQELERLQAVLSNLERGVGRIVSLIGGAGLGKSRLIQELKRTLRADSNLSWLDVASLSYEASDPYGLFQQLVRRLNGISASDDADHFWEKIKDLIAQVPGSDPDRYTRVFAALFGQEDSSGQIPLEGEMFKRELFAVMGEIWQQRFSEKPTLLVFDDLHWADPASVDLLLHLLPAVENSPVVLLCAFRPERGAPVYRLKQTGDTEYPHRYTEINLRPLSVEQSNELVDRLLSVAELPDGLRDRIQERAAGNPFYVEEVVRTLIEKGAVVPEDRSENGVVRRYWRAVSENAAIDIPENLQGLLASRIDRLEESTRHIVQLASVIGRSFYHRVLAEIGRQEDLSVESVDDQVSRLVRLEMLQEAARVPDVEYRFRNPMTQEIAYQAILLKRRREFHGRVGAALETLFPDQLAELAPRLAFHYSEAQAAEKAFEYYTRAGDNAFRLFALDEALRNYDHALEWARRGEVTAAQWIHIYNRRGRTLELQMRNDEALQNYQALEALGDEQDDREVRLAGLVSQGVFYTVGNFDIEKSREVTEQALLLAQELGDRFTEARCLWSMLLAATWFDTDTALESGRRGLALARELAEEPAASNDVRELLALLLMDLTIPLIGSGQVTVARDYAGEARGLFEHLGNLPMASTATQRQGLALKAEGRYQEAEEAYDQSMQLDQSMGNDGGLVGSVLGLVDIYPRVGKFGEHIRIIKEAQPIFVRTNRIPPELSDLYPVEAYFYMGAYAKILELSDQIRAFREASPAIWPDMFMCFLARALIKLERLEQAGEVIAEIREGGGSVNYLIPLATQVPQVKAELAAASGDGQAALIMIDEFLEQLRKDRMLNYLTEKILTRGQILYSLGRVDEARDSFEEALALATHQNAHPMLWQAAAHLAQMELDRGEETAAQGLYRQARTAVDFIADHSGSEDLRASFLTLPQVRTVLSHSGG